MRVSWNDEQEVRKFVEAARKFACESKSGAVRMFVFQLAKGVEVLFERSKREGNDVRRSTG